MRIVLFLFIALALFIPGVARSQDRLATFKTLVPEAAAPLKSLPKMLVPEKSGGRDLGGGVYELVGNGTANGLTSASFDIEPSKLYRFRMKGTVVKEGSGNCTPAGFTFASYDYASLRKNETTEVPGFVAFTRSNQTQTALRLAQWESTKTFQFRDLAVDPVIPLYTGVKATDAQEASVAGDYLLLGDGESVEPGEYVFSALTGDNFTNFNRPLVSATASFNTNRWCFGTGSQVVYRPCLQPLRLARGVTEVVLPPIPFRSGKIDAELCHYVSGRCVLEVSLDGKDWKELGSATDLTAIHGEIGPKTFSGVDRFTEFYIRVRGEKSGDRGASFQVSNVMASMKTDAQGWSGKGKTVFAAIGKTRNPRIDSAPLFVASGSTLVFAATNRGNRALDPAGLCTVSVEGEQVPPASAGVRLFPLSGNVSKEELAPGATAIVAVQPKNLVPEKRCDVSYALASDLTYSVRLPMFQTQDYTSEVAKLAGKADGVSVSWCEADWKVPRVPSFRKIQPAKPILLNSAKNDYESFQIVLCPETANDTKPLSGITARASVLAGPDGATIPAESIELRYAWYHFVMFPTDRTSPGGFWPDALVPMDKGSDGRGAPIVLTPGRNLPIWTTVRVPNDAKPGVYRGTVAIRDASGALDVTVPYEVKVWDVALPVSNRLETAFGLSEGTIARYHNLRTIEDKRAVWELYLQNFSDHRVSLYTPAPFDPIRLKWRTDTNPPRADLDGEAFSKEMRRVFDKFHFTNFRLHVDGLGGGTYEGRTAGRIGDYTDNTKEYKTIFADYGRKLSKLIADAGLTKAAYFYWFDEPAPKDYEFVANGFATLKRYMPDIARMLTEEPNKQLNNELDTRNAQLDIWCPVSSNYNHELAAERKAKNERFWWYVCCGPKAPYCTLFIDHPATELRVWLWQTYEYGLTGNLVWASNWWTSNTAFPDKAQNPYLDPMGYVSGGPKGSKRHWGNGDGRFVYPPLAAAEPGLSGGKPVIEKPVSSIRWEMIREGIQDYEMMVMLKDLVAKKASVLDAATKERIGKFYDFAPITTSPVAFTKTPAPIFAKRLELMALIVELQSK